MPAVPEKAVTPDKATTTETKADTSASGTADTVVNGVEKLIKRRKKKKTPETSVPTKKLTEMTLDERTTITNQISQMPATELQSLQLQIETAIGELKARFLKENKYATAYTDNTLEDEALKKYQCEDLIDMYLQVGLSLEDKSA